MGTEWFNDVSADEAKTLAGRDKDAPVEEWVEEAIDLARDQTAHNEAPEEIRDYFTGGCTAFPLSKAIEEALDMVEASDDKPTLAAHIAHGTIFLVENRREIAALRAVRRRMFREGISADHEKHHAGFDHTKDTTYAALAMTEEEWDEGRPIYEEFIAKMYPKPEPNSEVSAIKITLTDMVKIFFWLLDCRVDNRVKAAAITLFINGVLDASLKADEPLSLDELLGKSRKDPNEIGGYEIGG